ncbi:CsbD family protein [Flavobacterium dauae]|uniref:CsbD family protein n=1 Tax=Flavobacterium dauae TaxID=1563479 RepID=UPI00101B25E1|nr:CsbD family protein [Flavobacterium dauae]WLD24370.1 CsbD family protein [Flavobacterium dauae]
MDRLELEGKWNKIKGSVKQKYADWFNNDTTFAEGKLEEYIGKIQQKTGRTKEDIEQEIRDWKDDNNHL